MREAELLGDPRRDRDRRGRCRARSRRRGASAAASRSIAGSSSIETMQRRSASANPGAPGSRSQTAVQMPCAFARLEQAELRRAGAEHEQAPASARGFGRHPHCRGRGRRHARLLSAGELERRLRSRPLRPAGRRPIANAATRADSDDRGADRDGRHHPSVNDCAGAVAAVVRRRSRRARPRRARRRARGSRCSRPTPGPPRPAAPTRARRSRPARRRAPCPIPEIVNGRDEVDVGRRRRRDGGDPREPERLQREARAHQLVPADPVRERAGDRGDDHRHRRPRQDAQPRLRAASSPARSGRTGRAGRSSRTSRTRMKSDAVFASANVRLRKKRIGSIGAGAAAPRRRTRRSATTPASERSRRSPASVQPTALPRTSAPDDPEQPGAHEPEAGQVEPTARAAALVEPRAARAARARARSGRSARRSSATRCPRRRRRRRAGRTRPRGR